MLPQHPPGGLSVVVLIGLALILTLSLSAAVVTADNMLDTETLAVESAAQSHSMVTHSTATPTADRNNQAATAVTTAQNVVALTISVTDREGDPVGNTNLTAEWDGGQKTAQTVSNGRAFIDVPAGSNVTITMNHPDYINNSPVTVENATEQEVPLEVALRGSVTVQVDRDDSPVADAAVRIRDDGLTVVSASTDEQGEFSSPDIEQGEYQLQVSKESHFTNTTTIQVGEDSNQTVQLRQGSIPLSVVVADDHGSETTFIQGAQVTVEGIGAVTTLGNGETTVSVPVNSRVQLEVAKDGYGTTRRQKLVKEQPTDVEFLISRTPAVSLDPETERVVAGERLSVTVTNEYGEPVQGASVRVDTDLRVETDADGTATVDIDDPGEREVTASKGSLESAPVTIRGVADETETTTSTSTSADTSTETDTETQTATEESVPGFGVVVGVVAMMTFLAAASHRE